MTPTHDTEDAAAPTIATRGRSDVAPNDDHELVELQSQAGNRAVTEAIGSSGTVARSTDGISAVDEVQAMASLDASTTSPESTELPEEEPAPIAASPGVARSAEGVDTVAGPLPGEIADRIERARPTGGSLHNDVRREMEAGFGTSFADVRIHTGSEADRLNRSLQAKAFTTGSDIFLRGDAPSATSTSGKHLLAHELAHVVQQRVPAPAGPMTVGRSDDPAEAAADVAAATALRQASSSRDDDR